MKTVELIENKIMNAFEKDSLPSSIIFFGPGSQLEKDGFVFSVSFKLLKLKRNMSKEKFISLASSNSIPDMMVFSKGSTGSIKVDDIHKINDVISYKPFESLNRIFYFRDAETMTHQAQNALLKKIEEPGENNYFFLATNKKNSLLSTITSRCVSFYIPEITEYSDSMAMPLELYFPFLREIKDISGEDFINAEKKIAELEADRFDPLRLTSLSRIDEYINDLTSLNFPPEVDKEYMKRSVIKMRLAFLSYFLKNKYPYIAERIVLFLGNRQFFSVDSSVFYNLIGDDLGKQ